MAKKTKKNQTDGLREVKTAGFTATKKVKRDKTVNRRAGLHDKIKNLQGETRVKRRKPLGLKHVRRMRKFAAVASVGVVGAIAVVGVGFLKQPHVDPLDDIGNPTVCFEVPTDGTKPTDHTLVENVGYLNYVLKRQKFWSSQSRTDVDAAVFGVHADQYVKNFKQYYNNVLISADCSFSGVSQSLQYGEQFCQYDNVVLSRHSTSTATDDLNKGMDSPWSTGNADGWTLGAFRENRGLPPYDFSVYILDENTIANANDYSVVDNYDGTYSMSLVLNTNTGVKETSADYYYRIQMQANGGLNEKPTIYSTTVTYTFDESWRILKLEVDDSYTAKAMGMNSNCTSHTVTTYDYSEENAYNTFWEDYFQNEYERLKDELTDGAITDKEEAPSAMGYLASAFGSVLAEGAIFKVDLNIDNLDLNGVVCVEMGDGLGLTAKLGDILVWLDGNTLYINDGSSKYKLDISALTSGSEDGVSTQGLTDGFDLTSLMDQMTSGEFVFNEETGIATLNSEVELFGLKIPMEFEFKKTAEGVELNFLKAKISLGEKAVNATLRFGTESDKPAIPTDTAAYQDILNDGVTLDISLNANNFTLDGIAKIIMQNGKFAGVFANLDNITVYFDCPRNMLYLSVGNVKYKLDISKLGGNDADLSAALGSFDIKTLLDDILSNLTTGESSLGSSLDINIDALDKLLKAAFNIQLKGGLAVDADLTLDKLNINLTASLSNGEVELPDVSTGYKDILNGEITLDVSLTLMTGLTDDTTGKRDEVTLNGKVALCLADGAITEIRADFGSIEIYFEINYQLLYIKVGTTKVMINAAEIDLSNFDAGESLINIDLPTAVSELLSNLVTDSKIISTGLTLEVLTENIPVWAKLDLTDGLSVHAGLSLLGIDAEAQVKFSDTTLGGLSEEEKEEYIDVLKDGWNLIDGLLGEHISATVSGTLYSYEEKYDAVDNAKYIFNAALEYDKGAEVDSSLYLYLNIGLTAQLAGDESLYLDLYLLDANPVTGKDGKTTGGYTTDGKFDIYLSVSKYENNSSPVMIYAPVDEILTLVSMVGATAHLSEISFADSEELTSAVAEIANLLDGMLISKYLPNSVQDKFASLGDSLIPQILGVSLEELLNNLFGNAQKTVDKAQGVNISLATEYVSSINATNDSLQIVLNSSAIYNKDISSKDNITVDFTRVNKDGVYFVDGVALNNIYFGANQVNKLDLGLKLDYGEIIRPNSYDGFKNYLNADGLDTLLNGLVNSATHSKDIATDREKNVYGADITDYILNHYYYLNGKLTADLNVINIVKTKIELDLVGVSVTIDEETNDVAFNVRLHYNALTARAASADYIVIRGESYVDLTLKGGMLYIKRTQLNYLEEGGTWATIVGGIAGAAGYDVTPAKSSTPKALDTPIVTYRVYDLKNIGGDMNEIMDLASYVLNLDQKIVDIINKAVNDSDSSTFEKTDTSKYDFGDWQNYYLKTYAYTDDNNGNASWKFTLNGAFLSDIMGMDVKDPVITFNATYTVDESGRKSFTVDNLDISNITINFVKVGSNYISLAASGTVNYLNPQLVMKEGCVDVTVDNSVLWEEVFSCGSKEIPSTELWARALEVIGKTYLAIDTSDANAPIKLGELKFTLSGERFGDGKYVLYTSEEVLSSFVVPDWTERKGYSVKTEFNASTVTVNASYVANVYEVTLNFGELSVPADVVNYTYGENLNLSEYFGKTYADEDGTTWKIVGFTLDGTNYNSESPVISFSVLAEIYRKNFVLNVVCEEMENDTATHVTLSSTVDFSYNGDTYRLLNLDLEDGANYTVSDATAIGYTFLGWWYNDNGDWRKVVSVEEFAVEGKATFVTLEALWLKADISCTSTRDQYRKNVFSTLYYYYYFESEVSYHFEGSGSLIENITCTQTTFNMHYSNKKGSKDYPYTFDGYHSKLEQQKITLEDSWDSAKYDSWNMVVTLTFTLPDGSVWSTPQTGVFSLTGNY
ncbi:MAG: hypothetical protein K2K38_02405 [Clostridia bacterium]|nr:hypothetical protein [Clostridia bacterium]